jgi:hypothetical protein
MFRLPILLTIGLTILHLQYGLPGFPPGKAVEETATVPSVYRLPPGKWYAFPPGNAYGAFQRVYSSKPQISVYRYITNVLCFIGAGPFRRSLKALPAPEKQGAVEKGEQQPHPVSGVSDG